MKNPLIQEGMAERSFMVLVILLCVTAVSYLGCSGDGSSQGQVLARVEVPGYLEDINLPVYAEIEDAGENYYVLVIATEAQLDQAGVTYRIIDDYVPGTRYLIAREDFEGARQEAAGLINTLYDDGEHLIVRYRSELSELLPDIGFDVKLMSQSRINLTTDVISAITKSDVSRASSAAPSFEKNLTVEKMLNAVTEANVESATQSLSGEKAVQVDAKTVTLSSRHTYREGTKVREATQYVYEKLKDMGLSPSFSEWTVEYGEGYLSCRNVIGEIKGQTSPEEIVVLIAHLDTISTAKDGIEPGADDNASGCVGLLTAADIMRSYKFKRTIRFVFTTGEEQSLYGGTAYATDAHNKSQNIAAVLNLDMLGYSKVLTPPVKPKQQIKIRHEKNKTGHGKDLPIAQTYLNVVSTYDMDAVKKTRLSDVFEAEIQDDGETTSDHAPFWELMAQCLERDPKASCYPAAWVIEYAEKGFLNPHMHSANDKLKEMNLSYYTAVVKAALGTVAHLAEPVD